ncbi:MAG: peptidase M28 family protein, partial [Pseudomonadota bacterium]
MRYLSTLALALLTNAAVLAQTKPAIDPDSLATAKALSERSFDSALAYELTESLTTEVGPRFAGTAQDARARDWAVARLTALGFENVRVEPFEMDFWSRGQPGLEQVAITA